MPFALLALAIGAFGIGITEFAVMGLLPNIAGDLSVSIPQAGHLVSAYALGVVVGAPLLTAITSRLPRKWTLISLMAMFTVGNVCSVLAPSFGVLLAARVFTALPHGAFFGVGSVAAMRMAPRGKRAKAVSVMFAGLTLANVAGVPLSTLLGQRVGWRAAFLAVAVIGVASVIAIMSLIRGQPGRPDAGLRNELAAFRRPQVLLSLALATLGFGGSFAAYSFITPMMTHIAGFRPATVTLLLALFGVGMTVGNAIGGRLADRAPMPGLYAGLAALAAVLVSFVFTAHTKPTAAITIFLLGAAGFVCVPMVQTRIMSAAPEAPTLAAAANQSAFNIANAGGAFLGGLVIGAGFGYTAPDWVGALLACTGLGIAALSGLVDRRAVAREATAQDDRPRPLPAPEPVPEPALAEAA